MSRAARNFILVAVTSNALQKQVFNNVCGWYGLTAAGVLPAPERREIAGTLLLSSGAQGRNGCGGCGECGRCGVQSAKLLYHSVANSPCRATREKSGELGVMLFGVRSAVCES